MSHRIAYHRVSTSGQSLEAQRSALGGDFDQEFSDEGVSGAVPAAQRKGFAAMLKSIRKGDTLHVYALDRLGRDAIDVQTTVKALMEKGVIVDVRGIGPIAGNVGMIVVAVLSQIAEGERERINERCADGRATARASLKATGKTHRGKLSLGRPFKADRSGVAAWRKANRASIAETAAQFGLSPATVKRYCTA